MIDEYFGAKELYEVVLRAKTPMEFGARKLEIDEPVLYFEKINMAMLTEKNNAIMARGGWGNLPHVIWEDRSEMQFSFSEGVMSNISMGILFSANVAENKENNVILVQKREGPFDLDSENRLFLQHWPVGVGQKKTFIYEYTRDVAQKKVYGERIHGIIDPFDENLERPCIKVYEDKALTNLADTSKQYIVDYYYEYKDEALIYTIQKERFNGLFTLEGKFYTKDENDGINYTNLLYMPKVRVMSDISLRLGERADPTVAVFNIIAMPETTSYGKKGLIMEATRLNRDIDGDI